jgi:site-specific DNA recombinase
LDPRLGGASAQTGIDTQDEDATRWAKAQGHNVVAVVADRISGTVAPFDRKNLGPWLNEPARMAEYQAIIFANMTRYGRARDWRWREWAEEHGKILMLVMPELRWPPADPTDTFTPQYWDTLINQSIAEWIARSKGYKRMQATLRENNRLVGRPNHGYRAIKHGNHKILVKDPVFAPLLKEAAMVHYVKEGWSLAGIAEWLAEEGAFGIGGKPFTGNGIGSIFRNPALYGRRMRDNGAVDLRIDEPILTRDEWLKLQAIMDKKASRKGVAPKATARLTSVIHCPRCGGPMYRICSQRAPRGTVYYHCRGAKGKTCRNAVPMEKVHTVVDDAIEAIGYYPHSETIFIPGDSHASEIADIEEQIRDLDLDAEDYMDRLGTLRAARKALKDTPTDSGRHEKRETGMTIKEFWGSQDDAGKRDYLLNELHWKVYAERDGDGEVIVLIEGGEYFADIAALGGPTADEIVNEPIREMRRERGLPEEFPNVAGAEQ